MMVVRNGTEDDYSFETLGFIQEFVLKVDVVQLYLILAFIYVV
jgi:hypothetical protein